MLTAAEKLKEKDLKITPQRIAIYDMLCGTTEHPTVETIHNSLSVTHPYMSLATVYKTVEAFKNVGLVDEMNVGEDSFRYDANTQPHHHMICTVCHGVCDLPLLDSLSGLEQEITSRTNFNVSVMKLYFYGTCKKCGENEA